MGSIMKKLLAKHEKHLRKLLMEQYGIDSRDIEFYSRDGSLNGKIYFTSINLLLTEMNKELVLNLKPHGIGLYLGVVNNDGLRLSMDAAIMLGERATKHVVEINDLCSFMTGKTINIDAENGFCIVKYKSMIIGSGKVSNGKLYSYIPKARRIKPDMIKEIQL